MVLQVLGGAWDIPLGLETRCDPIWIFYRVKAEEEGGASLPCLILPLFFVCLFVFYYFSTLSSHCRRQRRKRKAEEMETLNKDSPSRSEDVRETGIA